MNLNDLEYARLQNLIREETGIIFNQEKRYFIESRLGPLLKRENLDGYAALLNEIKNGKSGELTRKVIEAVAINETSFFRDERPFALLSENIFPALLAEKSGKIRIWSAAASTGQEAYSIAITAAESILDWKNDRLEIIGTDISAANLEKASLGLYSNFEVERGLSNARLIRHFFPQGDSWKIDQDLRNLVSFEELNLMKNFFLPGKFDIIFLRNVLMYFEDMRKQEILRNVASMMSSPGYLILGASENISPELLQGSPAGSGAPGNLLRLKKETHDGTNYYMSFDKYNTTDRD